MQQDLAPGDDTEDVEGRSDRDKLNAELYALKVGLHIKSSSSLYNLLIAVVSAD